MQEETSPCMPHLVYSAAELDTRYPPLVAPPDEGLADVADDRRGGVYQHGLKLAGEIRAQVTTQGRRRRPLSLVGSTPTLGLVARIPRVVPAVVNVGGYPDRACMNPVGPAVETPACRTGRGYDVARLRHAPAACVEPSLVGSVDDTHADVPLRRRVVTRAVQFVQEAKASAGHSSEVTANCTEATLTLGFASTPTLGLASLEEVQPVGRPSSSRTVSSQREVVTPLPRVVSSSGSSPTVRPTFTTSTTLTSSSLTSGPIIYFP